MRFIAICLENGRHVAEFRGSERAKPLARISIDRDIFEEFLKVFKIKKIELSEFKGEKEKAEEIYATDRDIAFELTMIYAYLLKALRRGEEKAV